MPAVGPDSLATATAMPSMSAFVTELRGFEHLGSISESYSSEDIYEGGFHCDCRDVSSFIYKMNEVVDLPWGG